MRANEQRGRRERGSAALSTVLVLFAVALALSLTGLSVSSAGLRHVSQARESTLAYYVALSGINDGIAEVRAGVDGSGDRAGGLGAVGISAPIAYRNSAGQKVGEYRTWVANMGGGAEPYFPVIRVLAAVPSFAQPHTIHAMEAGLGTKEVFLLTPNEGALTISGPVNDMNLQGLGSPDLQMDGGTVPGLVLSDQASYDAAVARLTTANEAGDIDGSEIQGSPVATFPSALGTFGLSMQHAPAASFSGQQLTDYRNSLREYAEDLVHATPVGDSVTIDYAGAAAEGVVVVHDLPDVKDGAGPGKPRIVGDQVFGTPLTPATVLVDTSCFRQGGGVMTDNHGRTISGAGTLVILHPIGSTSDTANGKQFNLDWTGDVFVVGYPADHTTGVGENSATDNMLFISRVDWTIDGNLVVVTAGSTEASLEMRGLGSDSARLVVDGSVLVFGEASTMEAEIDLEGSAYLEVNGIVAVYGARVEVESQSATSTDFIVNGMMAMGLPNENPRPDDFTWDVRGNTRITYDRDAVESAVAGLTALQASMTTSSASVSKIVVVSSSARTQGCDYSGFADELAVLEAGGGNEGSGDYGVDLEEMGIQ